MDPVDRSREDDWFQQNERELLERARASREAREAERAARETADERRRLKELHWLRCPKCGHTMHSERLSGVEVDHCTFCEGVYLDAGELEQLFRIKEEERRGVVRKLLGI